MLGISQPVGGGARHSDQVGYAEHSCDHYRVKQWYRLGVDDQQSEVWQWPECDDPGWESVTASRVQEFF